MSDSTKKIKQDIESERVSRSKLGREDLEKRYLDLEKEDFPSDKRIKFIGDLAGSAEIGYQYELICEDWDRGSNLNFEMGFEKHDRQGIDLLGRHMISDKDALSRAWSATSLMQMLYNGVDQEELQEKTKPVFAKSLAAEKDIYASGLIM